MSEREDKHDRRPFLYISLFVNLTMLFAFKYSGFFSENLSELMVLLGVQYVLPMANLILPVGISFYTFQTLSYSIDIYNGKIEPEKNIGIFTLFVSFFPQLVAGPIERASSLLPQLHLERKINFVRIFSGLRLMLYGFFLKIVIADRLAFVVNEVYNSPEEYYGLTFWVATIFFSFQIYCDFSGYSSIAIGAARILGVDLMVNFRRPYFSKSLREFWQRWHISLSTWFKDYVYIPLGGGRVLKWRWYYNLLITFIISGLWHGANWTFLIWGALHGIFLILSLLISRYSFSFKGDITSNIINVFKMIGTFSIVSFLWIFFRANTLSDAQLIISRIFDFKSFSIEQLSFRLFPESLHSVYTIDILLGWGWILTLILIEGNLFHNVFYKYRPLRWSVYVSAIICLLIFGVYDNNEFIYFQF